MGDNFHSYLPYGTPLGGGMDPSRIDQAGASVVKALAQIEDDRLTQEALQDPRVQAALRMFTGPMSPRGSGGGPDMYATVGRGYDRLAPQIGQRPGPMGTPMGVGQAPAAPGAAPAMPGTPLTGPMQPRQSKADIIQSAELRAAIDSAGIRRGEDGAIEGSMGTLARGAPAPWMSMPRKGVVTPQPKPEQRPMSRKALEIITGLAPQVTQMRITQMQGDNAIEKVRQQGVDALARSQLRETTRMMEIAQRDRQALTEAASRVKAAYARGRSSGGSMYDVLKQLKIVEDMAAKSEGMYAQALGNGLYASHNPEVVGHVEQLRQAAIESRRVAEELKAQNGMAMPSPRLPQQTGQPRTSESESGSLSGASTEELQAYRDSLK